MALLQPHLSRYNLRQVSSGARTNLKVGGGHTSSAKCWENVFVLPVVSTFLALQVQLVVLASAFVIVSTVCSVSCLLFFHLRCPRAQPFVKVGGTSVPCDFGATAGEAAAGAIVHTQPISLFKKRCFNQAHTLQTFALNCV